MSEKSEQNPPERCSCCTCGYTWVKGQYGGHSCADQLLARVAELEAERDRFQRSAQVNWNEFSEALKQQSAVDERAAFQEWYATPEAFKAGDSNGWSGIAWAAWQKRAALSAPSHGEQVRQVVPEGWAVRQVSDDGDVGFVVGAPRDEAGVRVSTSVWESDGDPAHLLLWHMFAAAPPPGSQE